MKLTTTALVNIIGIVLITSFSSIAKSELPPVKVGCSSPGPNKVAVFQHSNYRGICSILPIDTYVTSKHLRMPNDSISSIIVGRNVQVSVCNHIAQGRVVSVLNFEDPMACQTFTGSKQILSNTRIGNDTISSAEVKLKVATINPRNTACAPQRGQVAIYQHTNFKGNCKILGVGTYENSKRMNFKNDSVSSIELSPNSTVAVVVCQHSNFKGRCETIGTSDAKLSDNQIGNDSISSMKVIRK